MLYFDTSKTRTPLTAVLAPSTYAHWTLNDLRCRPKCAVDRFPEPFASLARCQGTHAHNLAEQCGSVDALPIGSPHLYQTAPTLTIRM